MRLPMLGTPSDTSALHAVLTHGTIDELDTVYKRRWVHYEYSGGTTLLDLALANRDPAQRVALANRLLEDGADVTRRTPLHGLDLLQTSSHDRSVLDNLRALAPLRDELVRRAEQSLLDRGTPVPPA